MQYEIVVSFRDVPAPAVPQVMGQIAARGWSLVATDGSMATYVQELDDGETLRDQLAAIRSLSPYPPSIITIVESTF